MPIFQRFQANTQGLSVKEKKALERLVAAAKILSSLYLRQKNPKYPGANFYPPDATREEIERAAKKNPKILSPYTFVERKKGRLVAIPYRVKFKKELQAIAKLLRQAATLSSDQKFKQYLKARAADLLQDHYDKSNILWLKAERSKIGCVIGPFDRYLDKLFFQKRAYMAWIGILDEKQTKAMEVFTKTILASERKYLPGAKRAKISKVKIRIEDILVFSGLVADFLFVGNNLPSSADLYLIKKHGTLFTVFKPTLSWRFSAWVLPAFQCIFPKEIQSNYSIKELEEAFLRTTVLHESCHSLMRYEDAAQRLQEFFPDFDEIYTDLIGVKGCGSLLLKGALSERELQTLMLINIAHAFYFYGSLPERPHVMPYATGYAVLLDFLLKGKGLWKRKGRFPIDFHRAFLAISQLAYVVEYYIALGNRNEAKEFLKKFPVEKVFSQFHTCLSAMHREKRFQSNEAPDA